MARKQIVEVKCDRCERVESLDVAETKMSAQPMLQIKFFGSDDISFGDLCSPCYRAVQEHISAVGRKLKGMSPDRKAKPKTVEELVQPTLTGVDLGAKKKGPTKDPSPLKN